MRLQQRMTHSAWHHVPFPRTRTCLSIASFTPSASALLTSLGRFKFQLAWSHQLACQQVLEFCQEMLSIFRQLLCPGSMQAAGAAAIFRGSCCNSCSLNFDFVFAAYVSLRGCPEQTGLLKAFASDIQRKHGAHCPRTSRGSLALCADSTRNASNACARNMVCQEV